MATQVQLRRGTAAQHDAFVGKVGELTMVTDTKALRLHDGVTAGGLPIAGSGPPPLGYTPEDAAKKGVAGGYAPLNSGTKIPAEFIQFPEATESSGDLWNVRDFGAKGDGATDDTVAIQNTVTAALVNGGQIRIPAGNYLVSATINCTTNGSLLTTPGRFSIEGDGPGVTRIRYNGPNDPTTPILDVGNTGATESSGVRSFSMIRGICIEHTPGQGKRKICMRMNRMAFWSVHDCWFVSGATNVFMESCLSGAFYSCFFQAGTNGVVARKGTTTGAFSGPNALSFYQCVAGDNAVVAYSFTEPGNVNFFGGSIEGNPGVGIAIVRNLPAGSQGAPPIALSLNGMYFEYNGGAADVRVDIGGTSDKVTVTARDCCFNRLSNTQFTTNGIFVDHSAGAFELIVDGCSFMNYGTYVPSSSRRSINVGGSAPLTNRSLIYRGNTYASAIEAPDWGTLRQGSAVMYAGKVNSFSQVATGITAVGWAPSATGTTGRTRITFAKPLPYPVVQASILGAPGYAVLWAADPAGYWIDIQCYDAVGNGLAITFSFMVVTGNPQL